MMPIAPSSIRVGLAELKTVSGGSAGEFVERQGEEFYRIADYDRMRAFFFTLVSDSDHWMFLSTNGSLTAGRRNPEHALFPYYTDDKIEDGQGRTGSATIVLAQRGGKTFLWEPFSDRYQGLYALQRNLYKSIVGNAVLFEETNHDLGLTFSYGWRTSDAYGFVKQSEFRNFGNAAITVHILDGIRNLLPHGVTRSLQTQRSTLVDAYKKSELDLDTGLGIYTLSSIVVDRPEPSEALKATTVWSAGVDVRTYLVSSLQVDRFRRGRPLVTESDVRAERGGYYIEAEFCLAPEEEASWVTVAEIDQGPDDVTALLHGLRDKNALRADVQRNVTDGTVTLRRIIAHADGLQCTADRLSTARHMANTLFNVMRGGIFEHNYVVRTEDFSNFVRGRNRTIFAQQHALLAALAAEVSVQHLIGIAQAGTDRQLERLSYEYLPLMFSRRHGDPSRPWNQFSIETRKQDGSRNLYYEGNWRDIFQNWEALGLSFPGFIESMICVFVNASTADGYNPYRITREGIDWEVSDPDDPWSHIGYWGDHQIIYLLKLLEIARDHHPGALETLLHRRIFSYAHVPYRIKAYKDLLANPHDTIVFDLALNAVIAERVRSMGADGKLIPRRDGTVYLVTLAEKLLVTVLAKLTNFVPEAGIWMNTQRPEWNDANNALVGYGVSMVTLYYLRRFLAFCASLFGDSRRDVMVSEEVATLFVAVAQAITTYERTVSNPDRKAILDALGSAGSVYRQTIYADGFSEKTKHISNADLQTLFGRALTCIDHTIRVNKRRDRLFHAYNLMSLPAHGGLSIRHLYVMLEGQVAALSSGCLSAEESLAILTALRESALFRQDQYSYLLYPDRELARFVDKNNIPDEAYKTSPLLQALTSAGDTTLVVQDVLGRCHFNGSFRNASDVQRALDTISAAGYNAAVDQEGSRILDLFEELFDHRSYTGRSGTFFGYEGLGCIYWHMVSKLLVAVKECCQKAAEDAADPRIIRALADCYYDVRKGLGLHKTPDTYGAFPTDPYSHTPGHGRAQQPGMTGQVKEDIIARWGELGVVVSGGCITFHPLLLRREEFLSAPVTFAYHDVEGRARALLLDAGTLAFTYCCIPIVYHLADTASIRVSSKEATQTIEGLRLDRRTSSSIFDRAGAVHRLDVSIVNKL